MPDLSEFKIFIGGLHKETTTESLQAYFEQFGKVKYCQVKLDPSTGVSRGFGFILYEDPASVDTVIKNLPHTGTVLTSKSSTFSLVIYLSRRKESGCKEATF